MLLFQAFEGINEVVAVLALDVKITQYCAIKRKINVAAVAVLEAVSYTHLDVYKRQLIDVFMFENVEAEVD